MPLCKHLHPFPLYLNIPSLSRYVYAIVIVQEMLSISSCISSVTVPRLRRHHHHLPISPLSLSLSSCISTAVIIHHCLHLWPCLSSPLSYISTASVVILPCIFCSTHNIVFHRPAYFTTIFLCVPVSMPCLRRLPFLSLPNIYHHRPHLTRHLLCHFRCVPHPCR